MTRDADELYALPREEFTAARKALAKRVRDSGDPQAAAQIDKLAKPTTAAWLVNRLVRSAPDAVAELTELGDALRAAHQSADGPALRDLTPKRAEVLRTLVTRAAQGDDLSEPIIRELEEMFTTALLDESAEERLRTGRIASVRDLSGAPAWPGLAVTPQPKREPEKKQKKPPEDKRAAIAAAKAEVKSAEADRAKAERAVAAAEKAVAKAEERVRDLNAQLDAAEAAELDARRDLQLARRTAKEAERATAAAWRRRQQLEE
ncbi:MULTISPECIES: hypothetical protein [Actinokineospora]|uniref:Uncharacterized protein n=1 Tax=Actinokineospora fastidiosa TaxID=1816 RepID=A0A918GIL0_9PSEU|nr:MULTISPECIES: hypothetical protein [Actinokineospora]UVS80976.1 hypothetical protein Actkin_04728 [Actinokineospora sp. UTMC 2448]GGS38667.1 hypothetical protein GCM10010171_36990 [Actinokineospora fastidiosa]